MTREQKILRARGLRKLGWTSPQIGDALGVSDSTIRNWCLGGECVGCGAPTDGAGGRKAKRCKPCQHQFQHDAARWTPKAISEALRAFGDQYGCIPKAADWRPQLAYAGGWRDADLIAQRYAEGDWPSTTTVTNVFGSWNAALTAAGFPPVEGARWIHDRAKQAA